MTDYDLCQVLSVIETISLIIKKKKILDDNQLIYIIYFYKMAHVIQDNYKHIKI